MALKIGISSCLLGNQCNFDGKDLLSTFVKNLSENNQIEIIQFFPEDSVFGTPRSNLRILGGSGDDVLEDRAGYRSSAFSNRGRIIYRIVDKKIAIKIARITDEHDYKKGRKK